MGQCVLITLLASQQIHGVNPKVNSSLESHSWSWSLQKEETLKPSSERNPLSFSLFLLSSELNLPGDLKSRGWKKPISFRWHKALSSIPGSPGLFDWGLELQNQVNTFSVWCFKPVVCVLYYYSPQHLDHKIAFHFHFLTTLRVKHKFRSREYFYLPDFFNAHPRHSYKSTTIFTADLIYWFFFQEAKLGGFLVLLL